MTARPGTVYLVGAGPGAADLITLRGLMLLRQADVVIHDRLIAAELLAEARPDAILIDAGKTPGQKGRAQSDINAELFRHALAGRSVVRLKGGDPFVFGRGGEERDACSEAGVPCEIVPGVTSAVAAPAAIGVALTHRRVARSFAVVTAKTDPADPSGPDWNALARMDTLVVLMGRANLSSVTARLIEEGKSPQTPAACVERAWTARQRSVLAPLEHIADEADRNRLAAPMVLVVGPTVGIALNSALDRAESSTG